MKKQWMPPKKSGRDLRYLELRSVERLDPRAIYGKPLNGLDLMETREFLGYNFLRIAEEIEAVESLEAVNGRNI